MHIKSLEISGFKSYRSMQRVEFSDKVNIVVGRNGAGKSNFFSAIRFLLSDAYTLLGRTERQALLHEGSSTAATFSAYVEVVFDNSDGRFQTGRDEVILRRTIGAKKDDYSLDRKSTSKAEVMSILESAGFSRSNPFYIVPQGRVTALTNQKDHERLELLKEIAGTRVYEDRRAESVKIMEETDQKRAKIDELLDYIDERLNELEEEKRELKEFQQADRERRCLEYAIYQHDLEEAISALAQIEEDRINDSAAESARREVSQKREREISALEAEIADFRERLELIKLDRQQAEADRRESHRARTQVELLIRDLEDASARNQKEHRELQRELEALQGEIQEKEDELEELEPKYDEALEEENRIRVELEQAEAKQQNLFDKQGRVSQFSSQSERDKYLRAEIKTSKQFLEERERSLQSVNSGIESTQSGLERSRAREEKARAELETKKKELAQMTTELGKVDSKHAELDEKRKEGWKEDSRLDATLTSAKEQLRNAERTLYATMDRATQQGLAAVDRIKDRLRLDGVYGPLFSLFSVDDMFRTAVEVTAGNSLFHIVVDNDDTASKILDVLIKERAGRVTFMPLNRIRPRPVQYPEQQDEAVPLITRLRFDDRFRPAMQQVFSKTVLCPDLNVGGQFARSHGLTAITLQGDKFEKKGSMSGGYHDPRRSRLESAKTLRAVQSRVTADEAKKLEIKRSLRELDQEITQLRGEQQKLQRRCDAAREDVQSTLLAEIDMLTRDIEHSKTKLARLVTQRGDLDSETANIRVKIEGYEEELKTPMREALTSSEKKQLGDLTTDIQAKKKELTAITKDRASLAGKKSTLEIELSQRLRRKRDNLQAKLESLAEGESEMDLIGTAPQASAQTLEARRAELKRLDTSLKSLIDKLAVFDSDVDKINKSIAEKEKEVEALQANEAEESRGIARQQKNSERNLMKRQILLGKKEELNKQIRELGVLPEEAYNRHKQGIKVEKLIKSLHKVKDTLKKFTSVNKKAFDQYNEFTRQRDDLTQRKEELDESAQSITELIDTLDLRKDEAIERTFKQVSKNFELVFEKLVPQGRGRLIMQSTLNEASDEEEDGSEEEEESQSGDDQDESDDEEDEEEEEEEERASKRQRKAASSRTRSGRGSKAESSQKGARPTKTKSTKGKKASGKGVISSAKTKAKAKAKTGTKSRIDSYTGVAIKVSFNSKSDEGLRIQQLSGGQKSLVALTMIFAIQKCDPAPFYLFDEIDANLDADRRSAVAGMIKELSQSAQFIITTFRPELVGNADRFLGVIFDQRKVSSVQTITQEDAYDFVEAAEGQGQQQQGQGQGQGQAPRPVRRP